MKLTATLTALTILTTGAANAQSRIDALCGQDHINEVTAPGDVRANPDGYYIASLQTQLSRGDPRIIQAVGAEFYLCTRGAATPDMDASRALLMMNARQVSYLFVPVDGCEPKPGM